VYFGFRISNFFFFILFFFVTTGYSQNKPKVVVRANDGLVYFYKEGVNADSTLTKEYASFYLICRERQKNNVLIYIDNARLMATENDSTVYAEYLPGLKYEAWFVQSEDSLGAEGKIQRGKMVFTSFLNGTTQVEKHKIRIQIYLKKENELILENVYDYKD
jgi:hypothetical protein